MLYFLGDNTGVIKPDQVGGKASNLKQLFKAFRVPDGFVITPDDELVEKGMLEAFDQLGTDKVAVRSSATNEDGVDAAWAGQLETVLNTTRSELLAAIQHCRSSVESDRAQAYGQQQGVTSGKVAVLVQTMLAPSVSGVAFSRHPVTGEQVIVVEATKGLADALVSGEVTPDTYIVDGQQVTDVQLAEGKPLLANENLLEMAETVRAIEKQLGYAVDVEWAIQDDELYILQARPITTL